LMVLKRPLTSSKARLLTDIDASFNIFYKPNEHGKEK
jgi:hypothetical protein